LLSRVTNELGWDYKSDDDHLTQLLRRTYLLSHFKLRDPAVIFEGEKQITLQLQGEENIPTDFRTTIKKTVNHSSNVSTFEFFSQNVPRNISGLFLFDMIAKIVILLLKRKGIALMLLSVVSRV